MFIILSFLSVLILIILRVLISLQPIYVYLKQFVLLFKQEILEILEMWILNKIVILSLIQLCI